MGLLRSVPRSQLPPHVLSPPRGFGPPRGLRPPPGLTTCGLRQLQSATRHSGLPPPIGLVDFVGFECEEYTMRAPPVEYPHLDNEEWHRREARVKAFVREMMEHHSFQPLVRVANEVPELELAGVLLDEVNRKRDKMMILGKTYLAGGDLEYVDIKTGEEFLGDEEDANGQVSITLSPPSLIVVHKDAVKEGHRTIEEAEDDYWTATEAELDQVVCRSPYFKLSHKRHGEFQPKGSAR